MKPLPAPPTLVPLDAPDGAAILCAESFAAGALPAGWYTDTPYPKHRVGAWECRPWDGVIVPLPHAAWRWLRVVIEIAGAGPAAGAYCSADGRSSFNLALGDRPTARQQVTEGANVLAHQAAPAPLRAGAASLTFTWSDDAMRADVDGVEVLAAPNPRRSAHAGAIHLGFHDCEVRSVSVFGVSESAVPPPPRPLRDDYPLEVTVDFNDDLMACAWSHDTFANLFAELKSWGTRTVSWIDLGRADDAYFDFAPLGIAEHARQTMANVGDIFTTAVEHAHRQGIELIGILKPFDMAIHGHSWPPRSELARRHGRIHRIGGSAGWATRMAADHQHLITARRPDAHGPARQPVWTAIELVKDDDAPAAITPDDVTIIVSDDNEHFRAYDGPVVRSQSVRDYPLYRCTPSGPTPTMHTRRSRVFRLEGLRLTAPFVALVVRGGARSFVNRLCDLVHVFGADGEETHLTFGLSPRRLGHDARFNLTPDQAGGLPTVGPQGGFEFDRYPGSPSALNVSGGDPITLPLALDRGAVSYLALARGKDRGPLAVLSPSFAQTRSLWMGWVRAMLDAGADGIDIRFGHHHGHFAWGEYGFETPVRDQMRRLTGADIWRTDDFDHDLWRRVRGDGWSQFIREASALARSRGKRFIAHIESHYDHAPGAPGAPGVGGSMNMVYDWRSWIDEGLLDGITAKSLWPGADYSRQVVEAAHRRGVPVSYAPYCNNFFEKRGGSNHLGDSPAGCHLPVARLIEWGRSQGADRFVFYECASALRARADGAVALRPGAEPMREMMRARFGAR